MEQLIQEKLNFSLINYLNKGDLNKVKLLVEQGADLNHTEDSGISLLGCAAREGHLHISQYLVELGIDVQANNNEALICSAINGHLDIVKLLIENGADLNNTYSEENPYTDYIPENDALSDAAYSGHLHVVTYLLTQKMNSLSKNNALITACANGHLEIIKLLIKNGADIHFQENSILSTASKNGQLEIIKFLIIEHQYNPETALETVKTTFINKSSNENEIIVDWCENYLSRKQLTHHLEQSLDKKELNSIKKKI